GLQILDLPIEVRSLVPQPLFSREPPARAGGFSFSVFPDFLGQSARSRGPSGRADHGEAWTFVSRGSPACFQTHRRDVRLNRSRTILITGDKLKGFCAGSVEFLAWNLELLMSNRAFLMSHKIYYVNLMEKPAPRTLAPNLLI